VVTEPGTNVFHGSAYEFLRNSALNARNFFDTTSDPVPSRSNQFGATLGGPIKKEKLFFFFNYEGLRRAESESLLAFVPDDNARQGILPGLSAPLNIDSSIKRILDLYPLPNGRNLGSGVAEYRSSADAPAHENYFLGRIDWVMSPRDSVFARYVSDRGDLVQPYAGSQIPLWPEQDQTANQYFTLEEKRVISRSFVNTLRFSFVRPVETGRTSTRHNALQFENLGRQDAVVDPGGGVSSIGSNLTVPFALVQNKFTYADDLNWFRGAHSFQFGSSVERIQSNTNISYFSTGWYIFDDIASFLRATPSAFLGGADPNANGSRDFREVAVTPYFQDRWKVRHNFTLNIGLRYDYATNPKGVRHPLFTFVNPPNGTLLYDLRQVPYQMEWSLSLQHEILNSVITVGYVGSRGVHLLVPRDINPPRPLVGPDGWRVTPPRAFGNNS
jgi:outer membrane receptor protein involved in Fe transport